MYQGSDKPPRESSEDTAVLVQSNMAFLSFTDLNLHSNFLVLKNLYFQKGFLDEWAIPFSKGSLFLICFDIEVTMNTFFIGIVTKVSLVRPKVVKSVHYCPTTTKNLERNYSDLTSLEAYPSSAAYPTQDDDGNPLQTEYGLSTYKDHQTLTIQELPEKAPTGQLPRSVDVILEHDLVDQTKPGDRVQIIASLRALPGKQGGYTTGTL